MPLFDKLKAKLDSTRGGSSSSSANYATCTLPLGPESVIRYRQQRGVNLGSYLFFFTEASIELIYPLQGHGLLTSAGSRQTRTPMYLIFHLMHSPVQAM
jgi:hypothetical protein